WTSLPIFLNGKGLFFSVILFIIESLDRGGIKMLDTKKGKYTHEENERIIQKINDDFAQGIREKETLKELSRELNRGFAGIMSHVRKLRNQFPDRFPAKQKANRSRNDRMNSWTEAEEQLVIETVNRHLEQGKPLSTAISGLERQLKRTQGAIY